MKTPRIEEMVETIKHQMCCSFPLYMDGDFDGQAEQIDEAVQTAVENILPRMLTQAHQAGIEEAVEKIDTWAVESQYGMWNGDTKNPRHEMVVNVHKLREALDDTIKALQDNK